MVPTDRVATHPGEMLLREFLLPWFARRIGLQREVLEAFVDGTSPVTQEISVALGSEFDISVQYWLNLQRHYDESLERAVTDDAG